MGQIFALYQSRCYKAGAMDFDDLLLNTYRLFKEHPEALYRYQHKFKYIMVDEYQDTNLCQYMIVKSLANMYENICVVGDDSQSIYSFRGANIQNILNFEKDYPDLKVFKLEHNYRSTGNIVNASTSIIANNKEKLDKKIFTDNPDGEKIRVFKSPSDNDEGRAVAQSIFEEMNRKQLNPSEFAILYRTNAQSRAFEESLRKQNIPYRIFGGLSFYQRKEVKDLIAYLRLVVNPSDEEALKRIINYPARKIGNTTIDKLLVLAAEHDTSIWNIIKECNNHPILGHAMPHIRDFYIMISSFQTMLESKNAYQIAEYVAKQSTLLNTLYADKTVEGVSKYENIVELLNSIKEFTENDEVETEKTLSAFLQEVALYTDADKDAEGDDKVTLMTIHSSKGLEFKHVYVVGLEENLFPSQLSLNSRPDLEEERRLFYVAITRAEEQLTLSFATSRFKYGNLIPCEPSRFLEEIDSKYLDLSALIQKQDPMFKPIDNKSYGKGYGMNVGKTITSSIPVTSKPSENFIPNLASEIQVGQKVEHPRFGFGSVLNIDGSGDDSKAVIEFEGLGQKTLVLKFAKLMIHN
jgi:DNA helicase-2/ATP-dependent DNA helicase PcrA